MKYPLLPFCFSLSVRLPPLRPGVRAAADLWGVSRSAQVGLHGDPGREGAAGRCLDRWRNLAGHDHRRARCDEFGLGSVGGEGALGGLSTGDHPIHALVRPCAVLALSPGEADLGQPIRRSSMFISGASDECGGRGLRVSIFAVHVHNRATRRRRRRDLFLPLMLSLFACAPHRRRRGGVGCGAARVASRRHGRSQASWYLPSFLWVVAFFFVIVVVVGCCCGLLLWVVVVG